MSTITNGISMLIVSILILALFVMIVLGFMLGFSHPLPWVLIGIILIIPFIHNKIVSKRFIKWKESYSVGFDAIDDDHKKLLGLINQLQTASHYTTDDKMIEHILDDLIDYTKYHFLREEKIMLDCDYPELNAHKKLHKDMINQVTKFVDEYRLHNTRTIDEVIQYLKSWLINHINGSDKDYMPYLKNISQH